MNFHHFAIFGEKIDFFLVWNVFPIKTLLLLWSENFENNKEVKKGSIHGWGIKKRKTDSRNVFWVNSTNTI
jgi:hypothetical protein